MKKIYTIGALACLFAACKPSVNITTPSTSGEAVFSSYLAIGNSLTAGYADNSLYVTGQLNSYPQRLFEQFSLLTDYGSKEGFYQPLLHGDMGYPSARMVVGKRYSCVAGDTTLGAVDLPYFAADGEDAKANNFPVGPKGQINNIGVPGIRVADYPVAGYATQNPYAARFYRKLTGTPLDELKYRVDNIHPTFFTMWLGANDVLGYALAGGQGNGTGNALPAALNYYSSNDITPTPVFNDQFDAALQIAISTGAKGALMNIPDVTSLPYFTTIPANGLYISRQGAADSLTAYYASKNYVFHLGWNYYIIEDNAGILRQAVPGELILLSAPMDSITCRSWGSYTPIRKQYVLTTDELQYIRNATTRFNEIITSEATRYNLAYVDMASYMATLQPGRVYNGITYSTQYISGSAFSLDGIHLTPRGYALAANEMIKTINKKYKSTIPTIDANKYNGILFP